MHVKVQYEHVYMDVTKVNLYTTAEVSMINGAAVSDINKKKTKTNVGAKLKIKVQCGEKTCVYACHWVHKYAKFEHCKLSSTKIISAN